MFTIQQVQDLLTQVLVALEVGFCVWFLLAFPAYAWERAGQRVAKRANVELNASPAIVGVEQGHALSVQDTTENQASSSPTPASVGQGINQEETSLPVQDAAIVALPAIDLTEVPLFRTHGKRAVRLSDIQAADVPSQIRRRTVRGQPGVYVDDLRPFFEIILPEAMT